MVAMMLISCYQYEKCYNGFWGRVKIYYLHTRSFSEPLLIYIFNSNKNALRKTLQQTGNRIALTGEFNKKPVSASC